MKYRIANRRRFIAFTAVLILLIAFIAAPAFSRITASEKASRSYIAVTVKEGDTLWDLAKEYGPEGADIRRTVYEICKLNNLQSCCIYAGQTITIAGDL